MQAWQCNNSSNINSNNNYWHGDSVNNRKLAVHKRQQLALRQQHQKRLKRHKTKHQTMLYHRLSNQSYKRSIE